MSLSRSFAGPRIVTRSHYLTFKLVSSVRSQILKKFPEHGETLAFKSLFVSNYPERKAEAHELAKAAIKADIKSYLCWHIYGLLHRNDRNYEQAAKCYLNSLRMDRGNVSIARDLCYIQMQMRDIKSLIGTAEQVLGLKANNRHHWMLLAIAHHLAGHHGVAVGVCPTLCTRLRDLPCFCTGPVPPNAL
jgi:N-alpha-acetyltransferase 15/16, NatA auxiliary subunit